MSFFDQPLPLCRALLCGTWGYIYKMLTAYLDAHSALQGDIFGIPLLYKLPFQYSSNNPSKQLSWIDNTFWGRQIVLMKCSDIMSDHNVKLAGHIQNLVGQCLMTGCYFQLWVMLTLTSSVYLMNTQVTNSRIVEEVNSFLPEWQPSNDDAIHNNTSGKI